MFRSAATAPSNGSGTTTTKINYTLDPVSGDMIFEAPAVFQAYALAKVADYEAAGLNPKGGKARPCIFLYKNYVYDCTEFSGAHPGGAGILDQYNGKDITVTFHDEYNKHGHTKSALNMMLQYRVGRVLHANTMRSSGASATQQLEEYELYKLEELTAYPRMAEKEIAYKDFTIRRDKGLIWQAMFLSLEQYDHLIETPIYVPHCRLFDTAFLEPFSKTKFWVVAALWLPLSVFWGMRALLKDYSVSSPSVLNRHLYLPNNNWIFRNYPNTESSGSSAAEQLQASVDVSKFAVFNCVFIWFCGVLLWTLMEYCLHRFLFHFERLVPRPVIDNPLGKLLHLVLHGIHHIIPMDPDRLVFPPALFVAASYLIYNVFAIFLGGSFLDLLASGVVFGYVCYDEIHYLIHHVEPTDFYFTDLKKFHHAHHYVDDTTGYGISNKLWDYVFGTACPKK